MTTPALRFLSGSRDPEVLDALASGLRRWAAQDGVCEPMPVNRYVGLPASPAKLRRALRDTVLRELAATLDGTPWQRACELAARARSFDLRRWDHWQHLENPPGRATPIEVMLFRARRWCELPGTARGFYNLL